MDWYAGLLDQVGLYDRADGTTLMTGSGAGHC